MSYLFIGQPAALRYGSALASCGFDIIPIPAEPGLNGHVAAHADTLLFIRCGRIYTTGSAAAALPTHLRDVVQIVSRPPQGEYPGDVSLNALALGGRLYGRIDALTPELTALGMLPVPVRQGYARCSVLALPSSNRAVTADSGLADAMEANGVRVLRIRPGYIALNGDPRAEGFIGGAAFTDDPAAIGDDCRCSLYKKPCVRFFGSLCAHPDREAILAFIAEGGYDCVQLEGPLCDFGGAVVV